MYGEGNQGGGFRPRGGPMGFAPVKVGEELDVRIEAVGEKGDGIARKSGFILFVPNTKEGDEVRIRVTKVLRKVGFAEVAGQAQGPVEKSAPAPRQAERSYAPEPMPEPEPAPEDSEDFGDDPDEDEMDSEDEPEAEEPEAEESEMDVPPEPPEPPEDEEEKRED